MKNLIYLPYVRKSAGAALILIAIVIIIIVVVMLWPPKLSNSDKTAVAIPPELTVGNHTFVPLGIAGDPGENYEVILLILYGFELSHPDLEITGWKPQTFGSGREAVTEGLWIDHRPRQGQEGIDHRPRYLIPPGTKIAAIE